MGHKCSFALDQLSIIRCYKRHHVPSLYSHFAPYFTNLSPQRISLCLCSTSATPSPGAKKIRAVTSTRFLILSDTHDLDLPSTLPACDVVLHCGDLTENSTPDSISNALVSLGGIPAELRLAIAGNHDIFLDEDYCTSEGGSAQEIEAA